MQTIPKSLGWILQARGDTDGALNKYNTIQDLETQGGSELWNNLGLCFFKNQKIIAAISAISKSVWISPLNFNALFNMGYVFVKGKTSAFDLDSCIFNFRFPQPNYSLVRSMYSPSLSTWSQTTQNATCLLEVCNVYVGRVCQFIKPRFYLQSVWPAWEIKRMLQWLLRKPQCSRRP